MNEHDQDRATKARVKLEAGLASLIKEARHVGMVAANREAKYLAGLFVNAAREYGVREAYLEKFKGQMKELHDGMRETGRMLGVSTEGLGDAKR